MVCHLKYHFHLFQRRLVKMVLAAAVKQTEGVWGTVLVVGVEVVGGLVVGVEGVMVMLQVDNKLCLRIIQYVMDITH